MTSLDPSSFVPSPSNVPSARSMLFPLVKSRRTREEGLNWPEVGVQPAWIFQVWVASVWDESSPGRVEPAWPDLSCACDSAQTGKSALEPSGSRARARLVHISTCRFLPPFSNTAPLPGQQYSSLLPFSFFSFVQYFYVTGSFWGKCNFFMGDWK